MLEDTCITSHPNRSVEEQHENLQHPSVPFYAYKILGNLYSYTKHPKSKINKENQKKKIAAIHTWCREP